MSRRGVIALIGLTALLLTGCVPGQIATHSTTGNGVPSASAEATRALAGVWIPRAPFLGYEMVKLSIGGDGHVVQSLRTTGAGGGSAQLAGDWQATTPGVVIFSRQARHGGQGASATYRYSRTSSTLTLTWVAGTAPSGDEISAGGLRFKMAESDSWITGSREPFQLDRQR